MLSLWYSGNMCLCCVHWCNGWGEGPVRQVQRHWEFILLSRSTLTAIRVRWLLGNRSKEKMGGEAGWKRQNPISLQQTLLNQTRVMEMNLIARRKVKIKMLKTWANQTRWTWRGLGNLTYPTIQMLHKRLSHPPAEGLPPQPVLLYLLLESREWVMSNMSFLSWTHTSTRDHVTSVSKKFVMSTLGIIKVWYLCHINHEAHLINQYVQCSRNVNAVVLDVPPRHHACDVVTLVIQTYSPLYLPCGTQFQRHEINASWSLMTTKWTAWTSNSKTD